jgi:hypothetical protein
VTSCFSRFVDMPWTTMSSPTSPICPSIGLDFNIRPAMVSKHSELMKRQARDCYGRFPSPSSLTTPCSHRQEVGSSSHRCTTPPPSFDDSSVEMWEVPPPSLTRLGSSSSTSSGYNDECPHIREVSSYELLLNFNCLV